MAFQILARTVLELGAELISSDGIALYELIKNAIDAESEKVVIEVHIQCLRSHFDTLIAAVEEPGADATKLRARFEQATKLTKLLSVDARAIASMREQIAVIADPEALVATLWQWYDEHNFIRVIDTGNGMSLEDLQEVYLTIGTRSRQESKETLLPGQRAPLGEKGVGRLSTMRLGERLTVKTTKSDETNFNLLDIDWSLFSHSSNAKLHEVMVDPVLGPAKIAKENSGTTVIIRRLRADWTLEKVTAIANQEFSKLVDPFEDGVANNLIQVFYGTDRVYIDEIDTRILELAHGRCEAKYEIVEGRPRLWGSATYDLREKRRTFDLNVTDLLSVVKTSGPEALVSLGPFTMEMWWFNRRLLHAVGTLTRKDITSEVGKWSGGLMLFRDGYRVNPYGGGSDDWLELDKRAFAAKGFKLNRQQVLGRVKISWENRALTDQTNREGLTETREKQALVKLLQHVLLTEFKSFLDREDKAARIQEQTTLENIEEKIEASETDIKRKLQQIERLLPPENKPLIANALAMLRDLTGYLNEVKALSDEVANDRAQLVHLAGIGLMVEFIMHELARTAAATLSTLRDIDRTELQRPTASAISVLSDQLVTIEKRVANLDPISASRRQNKENFDVAETLRDIIGGRAGQLSRHQIEVTGSFRDARPWKVKAVKGMFIQIVENLLSNSFYWMKQQEKLEDGYRQILTIEVDADEKFVSITDNGPGVSPDMASEIFQPFVTRRPAGEGHGLGLYISRELATYHGWTLDIERAETVQPNRFNTFFLDMG
ncbi:MULTISPECIES: sensor histidine kinase [Sinorhizobium]|uniref:sensor histidine kinase n=1 Tax=Sinorhizobium TaxID=28105 RepID=UPI0024B0BB6C|nr:sensor histidine kinase [Sinorhizobium terangae]WFU51858.1 sensor histidine kinase [Sinorhizobium terangae]